ncbi:MAG: DUF3127 domain-containing protein [Bacteroidota bacterium]|jgi:hypothetical protein|nr:DUF3127 domain-containing protein [Bacteroidia bacterium]MDP1745207.1 DUF3127 domain-containing protein [Bacteroidota bacterium]
MDITGILKVKSEAQQVSEKFKKREFVLTDNSSQYPQHVSFQLTQDKCNLIDSYNVGAEIKVHFNLRGREWTSPQGEIKYFNTLEAWRIEGGANSGSGNSSASNKMEGVSETFTAATEGDDLPF